MSRLPSRFHSAVHSTSTLWLQRVCLLNKTVTQFESPLALTRGQDIAGWNVNYSCMACSSQSLRTGPVLNTGIRCWDIQVGVLFSIIGTPTSNLCSSIITAIIVSDAVWGVFMWSHQGREATYQRSKRKKFNFENASLLPRVRQKTWFVVQCMHARCALRNPINGYALHHSNHSNREHGWSMPDHANYAHA